MRKQLLYGRRVYGDIGPLNIDPVRNLPGRIIGPAVSLTGVYQDYEEESETQNFTLGSRMVVDERTFHYARCGAAMVMGGGPGQGGSYRLSINADLHTSDSWGMTSGGITEGERTIRVTHANFGVVATTVDEDELVGGWIQFYDATHFAWRRITGNTASVAGTPAYIDITVDRPWTETVAGAGGQVALHRSIYHNTQTPQSANYQSANGRPPILVQDGWFFWLQTWGPCFIAATGDSPGYATGSRDVYLHPDGTTTTFDNAYNSGANVSPQRVGYVMGMSTALDGNDDIMLQLAP